MTSSWLQIASEIGTELSAGEGASKGRWTGDLMAADPRGGHRVEQGDCGSDLYGGSAGIGLVLCHLAASASDDALGRAGAGAIASALAGGSELIARGQASLHTGAAGIALASVQAGRALGRDDLRRAGMQLGEAVGDAAAQVGKGELDLIGGTAGTVLALLALDALESSDKCRRSATCLAESLIRGASGWWGSEIRRGSEVPLCGLAHGVSGIAWALIAAGGRTENDEFADAGEKLLQFEDGRFDAAHGTWPDLRPLQEDPSAQPGWMDAWCHGAIGIGALSWHLWNRGRGPVHLARASAAMWAARRMAVYSAAAEGAADVTLCHGLAGAADLMLVAFEATGLEEHLRAARRVGDLILRMKSRNRGQWTVGLPGGSDVPGLFLGRAGLCALFLRLHDPSAMESPMLPGSRALARGG